MSFGNIIDAFQAKVRKFFVRTGSTPTKNGKPDKRENFFTRSKNLVKKFLKNTRDFIRDLAIRNDLTWKFFKWAERLYLAIKRRFKK